MIKVILWDLDQTLLDFKRSEFCALKKAFEHFGLGELDFELHKSYSKINEECWRMLERCELTKPQVMEQRFKRFFAKENIKCPVSHSEFSAYYESRLPDTVAFVDNAVEVLKCLKGRVKQYVVTNGASAVQHKRLEKSGLDLLLDGVYISEEIGYEKPSARFFEPVLNEALKYAEKDEILIVGDSLTSDIKGGNNVGIKTCLFSPNGCNADVGYKIDYRICDIIEVVDNYELW